MYFGIIPVLGLFLAAGLASRATEEELPLIPPELVPANGNFYSAQKFDGPPLPYNPFPGLPVYALADGQFLVDDTDVNYEALESLMAAALLEDGPQSMSGAALSYGCGLWLEIAPTNPAAVLLTLHNTRQSQTYTIWSQESLGHTNWAVETNLTGAAGDSTQTVIAMGQRSNLFFRASESRNYVTNVVFQGLGFTNTGAAVPDSMGAVGPDHFVELLNKRIAVYTKSGTLVVETNSADFFRINTNYPAGDMTDPRILYDHQSQRWVACSLDKVSYQVILAVSTNQSPTNLATGWSKYLLHVRSGSPRPDFSTLGMDGNGLYVTALIQDTGTNLGHAVVAIKKPEIYQGSFITNQFEITNGPPVWTIQPAVNFDDVSSNAYAWFVGKGPPDLGSNYQGGAICYRRLQWFNTTATLDTNWSVLTNTAYRDYYDLDGTNVSLFPQAGEGVNAPANGGPNIDLHQPGSRLAMTVIRNGFLWTCQAIGLTGTNGVYSGNETGTNVDRSGAQWLKLNVDAEGGALTYSAHGRVYDPASANPFFYYFPSLMVNCAGDMVVGFSGSSATNYIGAYYSWRPSSGSAVAVPRLIRAGTIAYPYSRWGDYSATTLDPTDDWSIWTVQEYADPSGDDPGGDQPWATVIATIRPNP